MSLNKIPREAIINNQGFTLIELLVTISIVMFLASFAVYNARVAVLQGRDAKRIADMTQITKALDLYFDDKEDNLILYESTPGGNGLIQLLLTRFDRFLIRLKDLLEKCDHSTPDCPCVYLYYCGRKNQNLNKNIAREFLNKLLKLDLTLIGTTKEESQYKPMLY